MGQGSVGSKQVVSIVKQNRPRPTFHFIPVLATKTRALYFKFVSPAYVLKNKILQHKSYSSSSHDSNDIKNLI